MKKRKGERKKRPRKAGGNRSRFVDLDAKQEQLLDIEYMQNAIRQGKLKGIIDSIEKSNQRLQNELRHVRSSKDLPPPNPP